MRVGIELREAARPSAGGIVVVLVETLQELFRRHQDIDFVVFCTVFNRELMAVNASNLDVVTLPLERYFEELAEGAKVRSIDVLFRGYPTVEKLDFPLRRQIVLIPDIQHIHHPGFFDSHSLKARRASFQEVFDGSGAIMTISDFARHTILECAGPEKDVFVARPGLPSEFATATSDDVTDAERATLPAAPFFFFPANLWPHKNHRRLLEALRRLNGRTGHVPELVLTGSLTGWAELRAQYSDVQVRHLGYVRSAHLKLLYENAIALTFFSLYEGFGIPVLEAFAVGTPVLCSNTTSLPEVAGDAALACDPSDIDAIADLLARIQMDTALRAELSARGRTRLRGVSWTKAADVLSAAIERVHARTQRRTLAAEPLVSIITPSYNQGRFIRRTIESVLAQTYPNVEYLVVDGGSTDSTLSVLESFGGRIRWISESDSGQSEAINKGLHSVKGEIVGYLNSDDVLLPDAIARIVQYFRDHPACDLVYGDADYIDDEDRITGVYATAPYSFARLMEDCCICQPAAYWRSYIEEIVGPFDEQLQYAMDYDYWIRADRSGLALEHMPVTIARSRLHADTKTLRARGAIYAEIFRVCRERGGFVSRSYVAGYWHYMAFERPSRILAPLRYLFPVRAGLVLIHHWYLNTMLRSPSGAIRARALERRELALRLRRAPRLLAFALRARAAAHAARTRLSGHAPRAGMTSTSMRLRVTGFWPNNTVSDRLEVVVDSREHDRDLRVAGLPLIDATLSITASGELLGRFELTKNERASARFRLSKGPREVVSFQFSEHVVDPYGRHVAFLLEETNVFSEEHLYALA